MLKFFTTSLSHLESIIRTGLIYFQVTILVCFPMVTYGIIASLLYSGSSYITVWIWIIVSVYAQLFKNLCKEVLLQNLRTLQDEPTKLG